MRRETCNRLVERALGIAAEMFFGENKCRCQSEVPLNAIAFRGMTVMRIKPKIIAAESPTARRRGSGDGSRL